MDDLVRLIHIIIIIIASTGEVFIFSAVCWSSGSFIWRIAQKTTGWITVEPAGEESIKFWGGSRNLKHLSLRCSVEVQHMNLKENIQTWGGALWLYSA